MLKNKEEHLDFILQKIICKETDLDVLSNNQDYFVSLYETGVNYLNSGNYWQSLNYFITLLSFNPRNAYIWNKIAVIFLKLEKFESAMEISRIAYWLINCELNE